jgi:hypothetical protein
MPMLRHVNEDHIVPERQLLEGLYRRGLGNGRSVPFRPLLGHEQWSWWARHLSCQENSCQLSRFLIWGRGGGATGPSAESEFR